MKEIFIGILVCLFINLVFWGGYWIGWKDREFKAEEDELFIRLDVILREMRMQ